MFFIQLHKHYSNRNESLQTNREISIAQDVMFSFFFVYFKQKNLKNALSH